MTANIHFYAAGNKLLMRSIVSAVLLPYPRDRPRTSLRTQNCATGRRTLRKLRHLGS